MKISIITVLNTINYGSVLQTYATQKYLSDMEFDTEFVDFSRKDQKYGQIVKKTIFSKRNNLKQMIKKPIKDALDIISLGKSYRVFRGFLNRNIKMSKISYGSFEELVVNPPLVQVVIRCGIHFGIMELRRAFFWIMRKKNQGLLFVLVSV